MGPPVPRAKRPDYGIDAPRVVLTLAFLGVACLVVGNGASFALWPIHPALATSFWHLGTWPGVTFLLQAAVMLWGSKFGKLRERDRLLSQIPWRGDEIVLDVGCGHGLLLLGAAKRLTTGKAIGIDLWQAEDQAGNRPEATRANAELEGVADRVELRDGDARQLPFLDASIDVVVSSYALHNIYEPAERGRALHEIVRVLKPGGRVALRDIRHTADYAQVFRDSGLSEVQRSGLRFTFLIPSWTVTARKPLHAG